MRSLSLAAFLLAFLARPEGVWPDAAQAPQRDAVRAVQVGSAVIAGIVVADEDDPKPVRRSRVTLNNAERTVGRTVVTDDSGRFAFEALPAGRYTVAAVKEGLVTTTHGAKRPGRPGIPIVVVDGQQVTDVRLRMTRGAVITGTILDESGQPLPGAVVRAFRATFISGERRFMPSGVSLASDDRGIYRIYGLAPGEYIVGSSMAASDSLAGPAEMRLVSETEVRRAMAELRRPAPVGRSTPGAATTASHATPAEDESSVGYSSVYYPGTADASQAGRVTLIAAEERRGIDIQIQLVPTARVEGTVITPDPVSPQVMVSMISNGTPVIPGLGAEGVRLTRADPQGRFAFSSVPPGRYTLLARAGTPPRPTGRAALGAPITRPQAPLWAQADVSVDGQNLTGISLTAQMGMTISGRVRFEGSSPQPPDLTRLRVSLTLVQTQGEVALAVSPSSVDADGRFRLTGVAPGRYRLTSTVPGQKPDEGWVLRSAVVNARDTLDHPLELGANQHVTDAVLTFTDRPSELSGLVQNAAGEPISDYFIVAFASDSASWVPQSRRIAATRPSADGRYLIRSLPPGEYRIAAVFDVEPGEWYDPSFLQQLVPTSLGVSLAEGEKKTQHLRLGVER